MPKFKHCSFPGCKSATTRVQKPTMEGICFLPFPKPIMQRERCIKWIKLCGLNKRLDEISRDMYICSKHFSGHHGPISNQLRLADPDPISFTPSLRTATTALRKKHTHLTHHNYSICQNFHNVCSGQDNNVSIKTGIDHPPNGPICNSAPTPTKLKSSNNLQVGPLNGTIANADVTDSSCNSHPNVLLSGKSEISDNKQVLGDQISNDPTIPTYSSSNSHPNVLLSVKSEISDNKQVLADQISNEPTIPATKKESLENTIPKAFKILCYRSIATSPINFNSDDTLNATPQETKTFSDMGTSPLRPEKTYGNDFSDLCLIEYPYGWGHCEFVDHLVFNKFTFPNLLTVSIVVSTDGNFDVNVNGTNAPKSNPFLLCLPNMIKSAADTKIIINHFHALHTCPGNPEEQFISHSEKPQLSGFFIPRTQSMHSNDCTIFFNPKETKSKRCEKCNYFRKLLMMKNWRLKSRPKYHNSMRRQISSLSNQEMKSRLKITQARLKASRQKCQRLKSKIAGDLSRESVVAPKDEIKVFKALIESTCNINEAMPESFIRILMEEQIRILRSKSKKIAKWNPAIINWGLSMKSKSPSAYQALRKVINMPSDRTLFNYSK